MDSRAFRGEWGSVSRKAFDHAFRNRGPMFTLKSDMDAGPPMHVCPGDYDDPLRWWL